MHALNHSDYLMPVIVESDVRQAVMPCISLALPHPALPLMAGVPHTRKPGSDQPRWNAPGRDHSGLWLRNAAAGLCLLAAAAAVVSFTAQYRLIQAIPPPGGSGRAGGRHPRRRRLGLRLPWHRAGAARPPRPPPSGPEPGRGRRQRVHERHRGCPWLAEPGHLGHAAHRLRPGERHSHRRRPRPGPCQAPPPERRARRRDGHPAGHPRRPDLVAAAPGPGPRLPPWPGSAPGSWPNARSPPAAAPRPLLRPRWSPHRTRPRSRSETKTSRFLSLVAERHGPLAAIPLDRVAAISAALAPVADLNSGAARTALRKAVLAARNGDPS